MARVLARLRDGKPTQKSNDAAEAQPRAESAAAADENRWPLPGLAPMTRVRTSFGDVHAVALRKGDLVKTRDGEFKPIVWLNRVLLDEHFVEEKLDSNPIRIQAGAVGPAIPAADILVSPHQIVCPSPKANIPGLREAGDLVAKPGVSRQRETGLSYTMFHLGDP